MASEGAKGRWLGRTLSSDKKQPKYSNSPESEIYNKRAVLYGLYFAKDAIRKEDECILVEGYTDVITLHQGKIENVVASSGTSLSTKEQIGLIKRHTKNIKIIYDGDAAGIKAALRGLDLVLESDMNVKLVLLPDGQDPDSFLAAQGTEAFQGFLKENEEDFLFFKTRILLEETSNDPIKKSLAIRDIVSSIAKLDSLRLAKRLDRFCGEAGWTLPILLEFNLGGEESKGGWEASDESRWTELPGEVSEIFSLPNLQVRGLMTLPPLGEDAEASPPYFVKLRRLREFLVSQFPQVDLTELSMGTSFDYEVAVEEGATYVRVGTAIVGARHYNTENA